MDIEELIRAVREENLERPILYGAGRPRAEAVVLERHGSEWRVFVSNERGGVAGNTLETFDNESDALTRVLEKARQGTKYHRALAERARSQE